MGANQIDSRKEIKVWCKISWKERNKMERHQVIANTKTVARSREDRTFNQYFFVVKLSC